jgi:hypothetical protein
MEETVRRLLTTLAALTMALAIAIPAGAVTKGGYQDASNDYDFVGLMVAFNSSGNPLWRCTGTLLDETHFLTAGHCTEAPAASAQIWFDWDVESDIPTNGYGGSWIGDASGVTFTHPQFNPNAFFLHDLGMVVLDAPYTDSSGFGTLPTLDQLDALKIGRHSTFTAVGYGLQVSTGTCFVNAGHPDPGFCTPSPYQGDRVRYIAHPWLLQSNTPGFTGDFALLLSNNASTGGTCFGDSGGPNFLGDSNVIAGVTSFGLNGSCGGTGGVYRIDKADDLAWLATFGF